MKILILGSGLMGPAAAFKAMSAPDVSQVILCDIDQDQLKAAIRKLAGKPGAQKLGIVRLNLTNTAEAADLVAKFDAVVAALPWPVSVLAIRAALKANTPLVDLALPDAGDIPELRQATEAAGGLIILGCGLEPGLTEIMTRHLAEKLDQVQEVHIKCGGIPAEPAPPLGYKLVFGGTQLPLREADAWQVEHGQFKPVARYSGVEPVAFPGVGNCEAWHEGFMPWLLELPALKNLQTGTQKTIRWPGYAAKVTVLKELGLLSNTPIQVGGVKISPKQFLDALLYPKVKLTEGERDFTLFRVTVIGQKAGEARRLQADMVDQYDDSHGFTSMARTTAFTGAIVACMAARSELPSKRGLFHPEQLITGPPLERLLSELASNNIEFKVTEK